MHGLEVLANSSPRQVPHPLLKHLLSDTLRSQGEGLTFPAKVEGNGPYWPLPQLEWQVRESFLQFPCKGLRPKGIKRNYASLIPSLKVWLQNSSFQCLSSGGNCGAWSPLPRLPTTATLWTAVHQNPLAQTDNHANYASLRAKQWIMPLCKCHQAPLSIHWFHVSHTPKKMV